MNNLSRVVKLALIVAFVAMSPAGFAETPGAECLEIIVDEQRLDCFDQTIRDAVARDAASVQSQTATPAMTTSPLPLAPQSLLDRAWVVDPESEMALVRLYHPNYALFGRYTTDINTAPYEPLFDAFAEDGEFDSVEAKFQLSFKARLWADEERDLGVWFAYTQQNQWQVFNGDMSKPFRETNYMPEFFVNLRPGLELGDWHLNQLNLGYNHQSNGRADPISRSWDRLFVEVGIERGDFALLARAWARIELDSGEDDNPDITDYLGYGELTGIWKPGENSFTFMLRGNPATGKGAGQVTWMSQAALGPDESLRAGLLGVRREHDRLRLEPDHVRSRRSHERPALNFVSSAACPDRAAVRGLELGAPSSATLNCFTSDSRPRNACSCFMRGSSQAIIVPAPCPIDRLSPVSVYEVTRRLQDEPPDSEPSAPKFSVMFESFTGALPLSSSTVHSGPWRRDAGSPPHPSRSAGRSLPSIQTWTWCGCGMPLIESVHNWSATLTAISPLSPDAT